ncbi:MAG: GHMP kinase [Termitinemataceae bacterium]|nr:MAG: GHMP kinase [Termitinemataceae bacterium]
MISTQTPFRLSFFGGGTDYKPFFEKYGGSVLSTTFDKYVYITMRHCPPFFDWHTQVRYSKTESVRKTEEIEHPLVRNCMFYMNIHNLSINYDADLPARSGLGSSSSFAVGLLQAMYAMSGKYADKQKLSEDAIYVERELCNEAGGWQDQIEAAYGGFNRIDFDANGFSVRPVIISPSRKIDLNNHLIMLFTGISRFSAKVAATQTAKTLDKTLELLEMKKLVDEAEKILVSNCDISEFGRLLDYTWQLKKDLTSDISTDYIDGIYKTAKENGAIGGKLMGAGGGGFMVLFAEQAAHNRICKALEKLIHVPFTFENEGSKILHYRPE